MIAVARRRAIVARGRAAAFTRAVDKRLNALLVAAPRVGAWTRAVDRRFNRMLVTAWPRLAAAGRKARATCGPPLRWTGRRLRPVGVALLRILSLVERRLLRFAGWARRVATRLSAALTPQRAICLTIVGSAACLIAAQFVDYRAVEIGQPGYAGLPAASAPTRGAETAGEAHAYLLIPVALLAAALALAALRTSRRRAETLRHSSGIGPSTPWRLGGLVFALGALSLAVVLLVDLPAGRDVGVAASRFSGAEAVLYDGFYAEIAAAAGLMLGGILLVRARKPSLARTQGGHRSARTWFVRKQGGRPRTKPDDGLQRPAATMRGRA